jgi:hypothetical protein
MNTYEIKADKDKNSQWLNALENTASDRKLPMKDRIKKGAGSAAIKLVAGIGGGFAGAAMGRWSVLGGILATGTGEIIGSPEMTSFGVGMMASNLIPTDQSVNGTEDKSGFQKVKDRMKTYGKGIMHKFFMDKMVRKESTSSSTTSTTTDTSTSGFGNVTVYNYPKSKTTEMDLSEIEKYEEELRRSAESFSQESGESFSGADNDITGLEKKRS